MLCLGLFACGREARQDTRTDAERTDTLSHSDSLEQDKAPSPISAPGTEEEIRAQFAEINKRYEQGVLDSTSRKYSENGERNGTITYYTEKGRLRMILHHYNEYDHYSSKDRYYLADSALFFIFSTGTAWSFEDGPEGSTRDNVTEKRVYLLDGKAVKCLEKKYVIRSQLKENPRPEDIANKELDCTGSEKLIGAFQKYKAVYSPNLPLAQ